MLGSVMTIDGQNRARAGWLVAIADGDKRAFAELFRDLAPRLRGFFRRAGHTEDADELVQETMLRVWRSAARYDPSRASVASWVFTIARNLRIDRARRKRVQVVAEDPARVPDPDRAPDEVAAAKQRAHAMQTAVEHLPEGQARVVRAVYFEHKTLKVVADELDIPLGTVKSRVRLALKALRQHVEPEEAS